MSPRSLDMEFFRTLYINRICCWIRPDHYDTYRKRETELYCGCSVTVWLCSQFRLC